MKAGTGALKFMMDGETVVAFLCVLEEVFFANIYDDREVRR